MAEAVCIRCAAEKDLALGRCGACGLLPAGEDRALSILASRRTLDEAEMMAVQARIRSGEALRPSRSARARAWSLIRDEVEAPLVLTRARLVGLAAANVLLTPLLGWAAWWRWRDRPGPAARQALWVTVPVSMGSAALWVMVAIR